MKHLPGAMRDLWPVQTTETCGPQGRETTSLFVLQGGATNADLIGCPIRVTVGEKALKEGMVEIKPRKEKENKLISIESVVGFLQDQQA